MIDRAEPRGFERIVGRSSVIREAVQRASALAEIDTPVLLQGATGVGKEVFARAIHEGGRWRAGPFVPLNCGGLPRELLASELFGYVEGAFTGARRSGGIGKIEAANGGTLFLDEIAEMPGELQPYLLRVLEAGEIYPLGTSRPRYVRFRLISATNRDLVEQVRMGRFRSDLFYRLTATVLQLPCLRDHIDDLPDLVEYFAAAASMRNDIACKRFSPDVLAILGRHDWPGNVRELRNVVEAMILTSAAGEVGVDALPKALSSNPDRSSDRPSAPPRELKEVEREAIAESIREHAGNVAEIARSLNVSRSTLYLKLHKHGLGPALEEARASSRTLRSERPGELGRATPGHRGAR